MRFLESLPGVYVIKTDYLMEGKGVLVTDSLDEAIADAKAKPEHGPIVIEEGMTGPELTVLCVCDGKRAVPLTPEQCARLTEFALSTDGKRFGLGRLGLQLTVFRTRGPVRTAFVGRPQGVERESYFCSELVVEALVYAGLVDGRTARPSATYPRDLFFDSSLNPYLNRHLKLYPCWDPPARWTSSPVPETGCAKP